jgi:hypothetical protein
LAKLKSDGELDDENCSYKDIVIYLYDQKDLARKNLNDYLHYMKQMKLVDEETSNEQSPSELIKVRNEEFSSFSLIKRSQLLKGLFCFRNYLTK